MLYKHTQKSLMMILVTLTVFTLFVLAHLSSRAETSSPDSGTNLAVTSTMLIIVLILSSFITLQVTIDEQAIHLKFGAGIFRKTFPLKDISSAKIVKNHRYYGRGIRLCLRPKMRIFNIGGLDAVELKMKNGKIYRIGTDDPKNLLQIINIHIK